MAGHFVTSLHFCTLEIPMYVIVHSLLVHFYLVYSLSVSVHTLILALILVSFSWAAASSALAAARAFLFGSTSQNTS